MGKFDSKFESAKQDWETPSVLFDRLNNEFCFTTDLAADINNTKCEHFLSEDDDVLNKRWEGICWLNPPYGSSAGSRLRDWVKKSYDESQKENCTIVMLVPARTNTKWWHQYCMKASEVRLICGRPKFGNAKYGLPQPLAIVVFKKSNHEVKFSSFML